MTEDKIEKQNIRFYDTEAESYDVRRYGTTSGKRADLFHKRILDEMLFVNLPINGSVLELGCGTGRLMAYAAERGVSITGTDISKAMLDIARSRLVKAGHQDMLLVQNNGIDMTFPDNMFDAVYAILVINLMPDYPVVFKQVARVLRPGGVFIFNVPNLMSIYYPAGLYVNYRKKTTTSNATGYRYSHWFTRREIREALEAAGLTVIEIKGEPPHLRLMDHVPPINATNGFGRLFSKSVYVKAQLQQP